MGVYGIRIRRNTQKGIFGCKPLHLFVDCQIIVLTMVKIDGIT